jgi:hypothetical protein
MHEQGADALAAPDEERAFAQLERAWARSVLGMRAESARPAARLAQAKVRDWMRWILALEGVTEQEMDQALSDVQRLVAL